MRTMDALNQKIIDIITRESITGQDALLARLSEAGERVTQSTLSRRLKKLRITKRSGVYVREDLVRVRAAALRSVEMAPPVFLVAHTLPGFANAVAAQLDDCIPGKQEGAPALAGPDELLRGLLGTIAGDDTVLIIAKAGVDLASLKREVEQFLQ